VVRTSILGSDIGGSIADLFERPRTREGLTRHLLRHVDGLSQATARKRAGALYRWREYVAEGARTGPAPRRSPDRRQRARPVAVGPPMEPLHLEHLKSQLSYAKVVLLTGSGFSLGATDLNGRSLPTGPELARELWDIAFPNDDYDEAASLQDVYEHALNRRRNELFRFLRERLRTRAENLPDYYETWFSMPWRRVYTLNVDDLEHSVAQAFKLPRKMVPIFATRSEAPQADRLSVRGLSVVHLNGGIESPEHGLTFSTTEYAERLGKQDSWYAQLASDLLTYCVLFVGTPVHEPQFWYHIKRRGARSTGPEFRPRSYLVCPQLNPARRELLREYNVQWVQLSAEEFAVQILATAREEASSSGSYYFELAGQSGPMLAGSYVAGDWRRGLAPSVSWGARGTLGLSRLLVDAEWMRASGVSSAPRAPVDVIASTLCVELPKTMLCLDARHYRGDAALPSGESDVRHGTAVALLWGLPINCPH
jgi:hypothetical protein